MPDPSPSDRSKLPADASKAAAERFKAEMPKIPGISTGDARPPARDFSALIAGIVLILALIAVFLGARWALRPRHTDTKAGDLPQIEVPSPAPDPSNLVPHATDTAPSIATVEEMAKPWSSKEFFVRNYLNGQNVPGILVRLPGGSASRASGYWAFSTNAPYGNCKLEYVTDLAKLRNEYGFAAATHPMVGNPCNHTVFDLAKTTTLPGTGAIVRGPIVQGSDLRPPLAIEIRVRGKDIEAVRTE